jgi:hypothetical protein
MKLLLAVTLLGVALASAGQQNSEAPTGFDNKSNGLVDDATHQTDQDKFDEIEGVAEGLGPSTPLKPAGNVTRIRLRVERAR